MGRILVLVGALFLTVLIAHVPTAHADVEVGPMPDGGPADTGAAVDAGDTEGGGGCGIAGAGHGLAVYGFLAMIAGVGWIRRRHER